MGNGRAVGPALLLLMLGFGLVGCASDVTDPDTQGPPPANPPPPDPPGGPPPPAPAVTVLGVAPVSHATAAAPTTSISIAFDRILDPMSVTSATFRVFGRWSGVARGAMSLASGGTEIRFEPTVPFAAGEFVTVTVAGSIQLDDGTPLGRGYAWSFWTAASPGTLDQTAIGTRAIRRSGEGLVQSYGAYAGDIDEDGDSDLVIPNEVANDIRVFLNESGDYGPFTVYPIPGGSRPSTNEGEDFDGDGDIDFATGNTTGQSVSVFDGAGDGTFSFVGNVPAAEQVRGLCVLDFDGDGDQDIATANRVGPGTGNVSLLRNDGGLFSSAGAMEAGGVGETSCAAGDANEDGVVDLFIGNLSSLTVSVLLGDGEGGFEAAGVFNAGGGPWMLAAGDMNGDGHIDVASANANQNSVAILMGTGDGGLLPARTFPVGQFPLAVDLGDLDGDQDLDVVVSNFATADWTIYENNGSGVLSGARTFPALGAGSCAILHDRDGDGDLDITGIDELEDLIFLFEN
ncbi:MAG: FG-GAP-like repeat-containing protein [Gemmatimonadota bacterium]